MAGRFKSDPTNESSHKVGYPPSCKAPLEVSTQSVSTALSKAPNTFAGRRSRAALYKTAPMTNPRFHTTRECPY